MSTDGYGGPGVVIPAKTSESATLIWLHGLGDTCDGWADVMPQLAALGLDYFKFVLPTAHSRLVRIGGPFPIPAWSDVYGLSDKDPEDEDGVLSSTQRITKIIEGEVRTGKPSTRIAVGGFSQGGAVALTTMLRSGSPLGACVGASTWLPMRTSYPKEMTEASAQTPLLMCHGDIDTVVTTSWGQRSAEYLKNDLGRPANTKFVLYNDLQHSASMEEIRDIATFVGQCIPPPK